MKVNWWVDGAETDALPLDNRGLGYGDGLFETMRALDGQIPLLDLHLSRLSRGAAALGLNVDLVVIKQRINQSLNWVLETGWTQAVIKIVVIRSGFSDGYGYPEHSTSHDLIRATELLLPENTSVLYSRICKHVLSHQPVLAGLKHLNRLDQVIASSELEEEQEGLMLDSEGYIRDGISSNIFFVKGDEVSTPDLAGSGVRGVMRDYLISQIGLIERFRFRERSIHFSEIKDVDEVIFTNAIRGVRNAMSIKDEWASEQTEVGDQMRALLFNLSKSFISY